MKVDRFTTTQAYGTNYMEVIAFSCSDYHAPIRIPASNLVKLTARRKDLNFLLSSTSFVHNIDQHKGTCSVVPYVVLFEKMQFIWNNHFHESIQASIEAYLQHMGLEFQQIQI